MLVAFRPNSSFSILPIANFKTPMLEIKHLLSLNYYTQPSNSSRSVPFWFTFGSLSCFATASLVVTQVYNQAVKMVVLIDMGIDLHWWKL
jgi:hypothetical protein